jgi:hypothetical protein
MSAEFDTQQSPTLDVLTPEMATIVSELMEETAKKGQQVITQTSGTATRETVDAVVVHVLTAKKLETTAKNKAAIISSIAVLAQEGATSPRFAETRNCPIFGPSVSVKDIKEACKKHNTSFRKLARSLQREAMQAAKIFDIEGNLAKSFKLAVQDASKEELYYASDFMTFSSDDTMPPRTRQWLMYNYRSRFGERVARPSDGYGRTDIAA